MRQKKFLTISVLLIFLLCSVSARTVDLYVEVKNSTSGNPISGATVNFSVWRPQGVLLNSWQLTTVQNGQTPTVTYQLSTGTNWFDINVSASGFQRKFINDLPVIISSGTQTYKIATVELDSNVPEAPPAPPAPVPESGLVTDVEMVVQSEQTPVQCPIGYAEKATFKDSLFNKDHKLCVKYASEFVQNNQYVTNAYLKSTNTAPVDKGCFGTDTEIINFFGGNAGSFNLCIAKKNLQVLSEQFLADLTILKTESCPTGYIASDTFYDQTGGAHKLCAKIQNAPASGSCDLADTPTWMKSNPLSAIENNIVYGWVNQPSCAPDQVDYLNYDYQTGIQNLVLYAHTPGCTQDAIKFTVYEGTTPVHTGTVELGQNRFDEYTYLPWCPPWSSSIVGDVDKKYSFKVSLGSSSSTASPTSEILTVKKPLDAQCNYDPNSQADDTQCETLPGFGAGFVCAVGNICLRQCETDQDCEQGICDATTGKCVECTNNDNNNQQCVDLEGENYVCNLNAESENYQTCVYSEPCSFSNLRWLSPGTNELRTATTGWKSSGSQCGYNVNLAVNAAGCEELSKEDIRFVIVEERFLIPDTNQAALTPAIVTRDSREFYYVDYRVPWSEFSEVLYGSTPQRYYFYVAKADDLLTPLSATPDNPNGLSPVLEVSRPQQAECNSAGDHAVEDEKCGPGKVCDNECNKCIDECTSNADCQDGKICARTENGVVGGMIGAAIGATIVFNPMAGASNGRCYECFSDEQCSDNPENKYCALSGPRQFSCVECDTPANCEAPEAEEGQEQLAMLCIENECTATCTTNADCAGLDKNYTEETILSWDNATRAANKDKTVCVEGVCVDCNANYDPKASPDICLEKECCFTGTACLIEENNCVECLENSICGTLSHCNTETHKCEPGLSSDVLGIFSGLVSVGIMAVVFALIAAAIGFFAGGPIGAMIGGLLGLLIGGGIGGGLGGLMGGGGGLGDLLGGLPDLGDLMGGLGGS